MVLPCDFGCLIRFLILSSSCSNKITALFKVFTLCFGFRHYKDYMLVLFLYPLMSMVKLRLFVRTRKQGSRIESVPLKRLIKLSTCRKKRWEFKDGWLVLEAF